MVRKSARNSGYDQGSRGSARSWLPPPPPNNWDASTRSKGGKQSKQSFNPKKSVNFAPSKTNGDLPDGLDELLKGVKISAAPRSKADIDDDILASIINDTPHAYDLFENQSEEDRNTILQKTDEAYSKLRSQAHDVNHYRDPLYSSISKVTATDRTLLGVQAREYNTALDSFISLDGDADHEGVLYLNSVDSAAAAFEKALSKRKAPQSVIKQVTDGVEACRAVAASQKSIADKGRFWLSPSAQSWTSIGGETDTKARCSLRPDPFASHSPPVLSEAATEESRDFALKMAVDQASQGMTGVGNWLANRCLEIGSVAKGLPKKDRSLLSEEVRDSVRDAYRTIDNTRDQLLSALSTYQESQDFTEAEKKKSKKAAKKSAKSSQKTQIDLDDLLGLDHSEPDPRLVEAFSGVSGEQMAKILDAIESIKNGRSDQASSQRNASTKGHPYTSRFTAWLNSDDEDDDDSE